jgi:hypothetical protein
VKASVTGSYGPWAKAAQWLGIGVLKAAMSTRGRTIIRNRIPLSLTVHLPPQGSPSLLLLLLLLILFPRF